jgi:hypothetical protein
MEEQKRRKKNESTGLVHFKEQSDAESLRGIFAIEDRSAPPRKF